MINKEKVLAIIPARGGSKGVLRKNVRMLGSKPLIAWSIEAARATPIIDRLIVSTDDTEIAEVAQAYGADVPFMRDKVLAEDDTPTIAAVMDALDRCPGFDWVILLQPTSPLRSAEDIEQTYRLCMYAKAQSSVSVCLAKESPYWMYTLDEKSLMKPILSAKTIVRRQDLPPVYVLNGAVYVANIAWLRKTKSFVTEETIAYSMPLERSIDIDTEDDFRQLQCALGE